MGPRKEEEEQEEARINTESMGVFAIFFATFSGGWSGLVFFGDARPLTKPPPESWGR